MYWLISNLQKVIKINDCHFICTIYSGIIVPKGYLRLKKLPLWTHWKCYHATFKAVFGNFINLLRYLASHKILWNQNLGYWVVEARTLNVTKNTVLWELLSSGFIHVLQNAVDSILDTDSTLCASTFTLKIWTYISQLSNNLYE